MSEQILAALLLKIASLEAQLCRDALTKVLSQRRLLEEMNTDKRVTVIAIDVIGLGVVNREQGHDAGDRLLQSVAKGLKSCFREHRGDVVYRRGGDEFVIILPGCVNLSVADRVRSLPFDLYVGVCSGTGNIGELVQKAFGQVEEQKRKKHGAIAHVQKTFLSLLTSPIK